MHSHPWLILYSVTHSTQKLFLFPPADLMHALLLILGGARRSWLACDLA
jgi:hypothetical protein